jgi:tetratricopeptide (TPR) repeat protein
MKTASYQQHLRSLNDDLQACLQRDFPIEAEVRCLVKDGKLLVLAQHPDDAMLDAKRVFFTLKRALKDQSYDLINRFATGTGQLAIQLYLRANGQDQPYAYHPFEVSAIASRGEAKDTNFFDDYANDGDQAEDGNPDDDPYGEADFSHDAMPVSTPSRRSSSKPWLVGGAVAGLLVAGVVGYALTRPCVIGECQPLQDAEALHESAQVQMETVESAQDVQEIQSQLQQASALTTVIPRWSGRYEEATVLKDLYDYDARVVEQVADAQTAAFSAAQMSQNPPHPVETWEAVRDLWEEAIAHLDNVPSDSPIYPFAQRKLEEYRNNLGAINRRIQAEQEAQARVRTAQELAAQADRLEGVPNTLDDWQTVYGLWQTAVSHLQNVSPQTTSYAPAQPLLDRYSQALAVVRDRQTQADIAATAYAQSLASADQAAEYEQIDQWTQAVTAWRNALNYAQQVPPGTTYYDQVQPMAQFYAIALADAQQNLTVAIATQSATSQLQNLCGGSVPTCSYTDRDGLIQVRVSSAYQATAATFPLTSDRAIPATALSTSMDTLLSRIAQVGDTANLSIDVYNADGSLFGRYVPSLSGYVPPTYINVLNNEPTASDS